MELPESAIRAIALGSCRMALLPLGETQPDGVKGPLSKRVMVLSVLVTMRPFARVLPTTTKTKKTEKTASTTAKLATVTELFYQPL